MTINYFSLAHLIYIGAAIGFAAALYFLLRNKSEMVKRICVVSLMALNVIQHLFKSYIYPQYEGLGFNALNSAYNMCALLILVSPIAYLSRSERLKDFVFYTGSAAGLVAILVPYWHIGEYMFTWDVIRFFICHALLFASSVLTLLFGHHKPSWRSSYRIAAGFFISVAVIIINDIFFLYMGLYPGENAENLFESMRHINPVWSFGPPEQFAFVEKIAKFFSPDIFVGENAAGLYVPILWYFMPIFLAISILTLPITAFFDKESFLCDMKKHKEKFLFCFEKIKAFILSFKKSKESDTENGSDNNSENTKN